MPTVCAESIRLNEFPWVIDPSRPHAKGESQEMPIQEPCRCVPQEISENEYERRRDALFERLARE